MSAAQRVAGDVVASQQRTWLSRSVSSLLGVPEDHHAEGVIDVHSRPNMENSACTIPRTQGGVERLPAIPPLRLPTSPVIAGEVGATPSLPKARKPKLSDGWLSSKVYYLLGVPEEEDEEEDMSTVVIQPPIGLSPQKGHVLSPLMGEAFNDDNASTASSLSCDREKEGEARHVLTDSDSGHEAELAQEVRKRELSGGWFSSKVRTLLGVPEEDAY